MSKTWAWRKSSYSVGGDQSCVEVASAITRVGVRDTKNRENGHLLVAARQWHAFIGSVKRGSL